MMELPDPFAGFDRSGLAAFPAYAEPPAPIGLHSVFVHPDRSHSPEPDLAPFTRFEIWTIPHSSIDAEWPIDVHVPTALRGFRRSLGLSQAKFAVALQQSRLNVERWEGGTSRPFRGHTLSLISLLRPMVDGQRSAGQLLSLAAAVVCPKLTRPTATYTGHDIARNLVDGRYDHRDLAKPLLAALVTAEIFVSLDHDDDNLEARYIPLVGVGAIDRAITATDSKTLRVAERLERSDWQLWLQIGERLAADTANKNPGAGRRGSTKRRWSD